MTMAEVPVEPNSDEAKVRKMMSKLWTNFAKYGNPTPKDSNLGFVWEPVDHVGAETSVVSLKCLDINTTCKMVNNPDRKRIDFWKTIYERWNKSFLKPKL